MELTKRYKQYFPNSSRLESMLEITVDYDEKENEVTETIGVKAYNPRSGTTTDLTAIFAEQFTNQLKEIIEKIDWQEILIENKESIKV